MKVKKDCGASSSEYWYDLQEGYLDPDKICSNKKDAAKIKEAIETINDFLDSCIDQIEGFEM